MCVNVCVRACMREYMHVCVCVCVCLRVRTQAPAGWGWDVLVGYILDTGQRRMSVPRGTRVQ